MSIHILQNSYLLRKIHCHSERESPGDAGIRTHAARVPKHLETESPQAAGASLLLLRSLSEELEGWFIQKQYVNTNHEVEMRFAKLMSQDLERLEELIRLWKDMTLTLNEGDVDPSYYPVFQDLFAEWVVRSEMSLSETSSISRFVKCVATGITKISSSVSVTTGKGMNLIWRAIHPCVPSTLELWNIYEKVLGTFNEFGKKFALQVGICLAVRPGLLKILWLKFSKSKRPFCAHYRLWQRAPIPLEESPST